MDVGIHSERRLQNTTLLIYFSQPNEPTSKPTNARLPIASDNQLPRALVHARWSPNLP